MSENIETQSSDVSVEAPSESQSSAGKETNVETSSKAPAEKYVPYERFQEIIQQKNEFLKRIEDSDRKYQELHSKFTEFSKPKAELSKEQALVQRLKGIDPEFGTWAEQQEALKTQLAEMQQWKKNAEAERLTTSVNSTVDKLHTEYKIASEDREVYNALLRQEANKIESTGKMLGVQDIPTLFKTVHDNLNKFLESKKRAELASYATAKKADAATPQVKKGATPKPTVKKQTFSRDPEEAKAQIVSRALTQMRAEKSDS